MEKTRNAKMYEKQAIADNERLSKELEETKKRNIELEEALKVSEYYSPRTVFQVNKDGSHEIARCRNCNSKGIIL